VTSLIREKRIISVAELLLALMRDSEPEQLLRGRRAKRWGIEVPLTDAHHVRFLASVKLVCIVALHMLPVQPASPPTDHGKESIIALGNKHV
jgi:hypothetical protein